MARAQRQNGHVTLCYCPGAVQELMAARDELVKARTELQRHDPNHQAIQALRVATDELREARELLDATRRAPELDARSALLLQRLEQAMVDVEQVRDLWRRIEKARLVTN